MTAEPNSLAGILAKIDQALKLLVEGQKKVPRPNVEMAIAALESARDDLTGRKPN